MSTGARRAMQVALVASVFVGMWALVFHVSPRPVWHHTFDLRVYRGAVQWWLEGHPVYDFVRPNTEKGFTYPPFTVLVLLPLAWGTETTATVVLTSVSCALVGLTTWWLVTPVADHHGWTRWVAFGVAVPVVLALEPVRETLGWGQIDLVIAALVLADAAALRRGHPGAGVGIGLATAIKVTPGLFLVYLAVTGRWRAVAVAATAFGVTALAGFAVDPSVRYWILTLWQTGRVGPPTDPNNQSLLGVMARLAAPGASSSALWLAAAGLALVVGITRAALLYRRGDDLAGITVTGLTACLISPISWVHHLYWVVPAVAVLVDVAAGASVAGVRAGRPSRTIRAAAAAAAALVVAAFAISLIWFFAGAPAGPWRNAGENAYVLLLLALVAGLPARLSVGRARARGRAIPTPWDRRRHDPVARAPGRTVPLWASWRDGHPRPMTVHSRGPDDGTEGAADGAAGVDSPTVELHARLISTVEQSVHRQASERDQQPDEEHGGEHEDEEPS